MLDCVDPKPILLQRKPPSTFVVESSKENNKKSFNRMSALYKYSPGYVCLDSKKNWMQSTKKSSKKGSKKKPIISSESLHTMVSSMLYGFVSPKMVIDQTDPDVIKSDENEHNDIAAKVVTEDRG